MRFLPRFKRHFLHARHLTMVFMVMSFGGCQSGGVVGAAGKVADAALGVIGLKRADQTPQPKIVTVELNASSKLNADASGRGLSVVAKLYKLKDANNFLRSSYETFQQSGREKEALGTDLIESKEILLIPGQRYRGSEKLVPEAGFLGLVVLYRDPDPKHWRLALAQSDIGSEGVIIDVRSCAVKLEKGVQTISAADIAPRCDK